MTVQELLSKHGYHLVSHARIELGEAAGIEYPIAVPDYHKGEPGRVFRFMFDVLTELQQRDMRGPK